MACESKIVGGRDGKDSGKRRRDATERCCHDAKRSPAAIERRRQRARARYRSAGFGRVRPCSRTVMARERQSLFGARAEESVRINGRGYRCSLRSV